MSTIEQRILNILDEVENIYASIKVKRKCPQLIAVSKNKPQSMILEAMAAGQLHFGENKVQEAKQKFTSLKNDNSDLKLHLIGPLQSNKVKDAVEIFDFIHSVDRPKLLEKIKLESELQGKKPKLFIQVNTGREPQKGGVDVDDFQSFCDLFKSLDLEISGLMCIPPKNEPPGDHFNLLNEMANHIGCGDISMGMSSDFKQAILAGATYYRVGTLIFGSRGNLIENS